MKKIIYSIALVTASILTSCDKSESKKVEEPVLTKTDSSKLIGQMKYTCTMHPEVNSDTAGHCPKCGMDLVPITDSTRK